MKKNLHNFNRNFNNQSFNNKKLTKVKIYKHKQQNKHKKYQVYVNSKKEC
jgi:hypothetical protein